MSVIGLDVGGTKIYAARYGLEQRIEPIAEHKTPTPQGGKDAVLDALERAVRAVWNDDVAAVGVAWAGLVEGKTGTIIRSANINGVDGLALSDALSGRFQRPVVVQNDARLAAFAEAKVAQIDHLVCAIFGTGCGVGVIANGQMLTGRAAAGELGHMPLDDGTTPEMLLAGPGLISFVQNAGVTLGDRYLSDAIKENKDKMWTVLRPRAAVLARFLAALQLAYDPAVVLLGGSVGGKVWGAYVPEVSEILQSYGTKVNLRATQLKNAGALGAAFWAKEAL